MLHRGPARPHVEPPSNAYVDLLVRVATWGIVAKRNREMKICGPRKRYMLLLGCLPAVNVCRAAPFPTRATIQ